MSVWKRKKSFPVSQIASSSRTSVVLPLLTAGLPFAQRKNVDDMIGRSNKQLVSSLSVLLF